MNCSPVKEKNAVG